MLLDLPFSSRKAFSRRVATPCLPPHPIKAHLRCNGRRHEVTGCESHIARTWVFAPAVPVRTEDRDWFRFFVYGCEPEKVIPHVKLWNGHKKPACQNAREDKRGSIDTTWGKERSRNQADFYQIWLVSSLSDITKIRKNPRNFTHREQNKHKKCPVFCHF